VRNVFTQRPGPGVVVDLMETPATPPFDSEGDERIGYWIAGATLVVFGWGLGVVANLLLHWAARSGPFVIWNVHFGPTFGSYAWAVFGLGLGTGVVGAALWLIALATPKGRFVLPGADY
jgi:hypothetical protein